MYLGQLTEGSESLNYYRQGLEVLRKMSSDQSCLTTSQSNPNRTAESLQRAESNGFCAIAELYMTDLCDLPEAQSECKAAFEGAIQTDPSNPQAWLVAANFYTVTANTEAAREAIQRCLDLWWPKLENMLNEESTDAANAASTDVSALVNGSAIDTDTTTIEEPLGRVNSLILAIAEVFWPHSVSSRLSKHVPIHQSSPSHAVSSSVGKSSATKSTSESDGPHESSPSAEDANLVSTTTSEGVEAESEKPASTAETRSASPSNPLPEPEQVENTSDATPSSTNEVPSSNGSIHPDIGGTHAENDPSTSQQSPDTSENDSSEKPAKLSDNTCSGPPRSFPMNNRDLAFATAVQQSLVATVSPAAWLATSGVLYMRVSSNEAGLLIGAGGYRIHQLMQSTGAEIHIGKTPIHEPYALNQANRKAPGSYPDKAVSSLNTPTTPSEVPPESSVPVSNESPSLTDETSQQHEPSDYPSLGSFVTGDSNGLVYPGDNAVDSSSVHSSTDTSEQHYTSEPGLSTIAHTGADNSDSPLAELLEDAATNSVTGDTVESQTLKATPPASPDSLKPTPPPHSTAGSYRLVSLSGPLQAQLLAQWRIFQRLKALHQKNHAEVENADSTEGHAKPAGSSPSTPFRLATLVCLPYRFLCWLTSSNSGFADFMCTTSSSPTLSSTHPTILHAESSSPLSWLQAQAALRMRHSTETQPAIEKAIHILPEPRRRRRLLQLQLRRSGTTRRGQSATHFNRHIVLPSVGLANDGLDLLWADPNRIPMEIYADHETTQLVLAHLHHMLALWLYGQALANLTGFGINQALSLYMVPPSLMRPHSLNQPGRLVDSRAVEATTGPPPMPSIGALGDWTPHWPRSPSPLDTFMRFHPAMHPSQMNRFPTHYGRLQRIRMPGFGNRWRTPQNDPSVAHHDPSGLERMVTYPSANHMRPFAATHPYTASAFAPFPGCAPQDTLLAQTHGICVPSPESFPRTAANLMPQCSGSQFEPSWHTLPPSSQSHFGWDQTSYLSRLTYESSRRHPPTRSNRKSTNASEPPASSASKHSVSTNADKESSVDPDISS
ncbi:unnamed protein product [Dicrocoelium dendriticum]|nr:unnamed protein product [Dicrocoelium dendriticum]